VLQPLFGIHDEPLDPCLDQPSDMKVLLVEDEEDLVHVIAVALRESGFAVDVSQDGEEGLAKAQLGDYDAIVLDIMLPRLDGWTVLSRLRQTKSTPVLLLTARDAVADRVEGLNLGADDYLTKPFDLEELIARLRALIRRSAGAPAPIIILGAVEIDTAARTVSRDGEPVELSAKEYALLELLALHRGRLVTRTMIYEHIYGEEDDTLSNVVDVYVSNLRRKLGSEIIETRRGQGYIIRA
jgi:two-component system, OmpR family, response regulator